MPHRACTCVVCSLHIFNSLLALYIVLIKLCVTVYFWHSQTARVHQGDTPPLPYGHSLPPPYAPPPPLNGPICNKVTLWVSVFISFDSTREHEGKFSWGPCARALKTLYRLRPKNRQEVKKDVFYLSTHVIITTVMSSHIQKLTSFGVARKI